MPYSDVLIHLAQAGLYGAIQGLTEFLPISSSGHLLLLHEIIPFRVVDEQAFDVALHFGTLIALILFFWTDVRRLVVTVVKWRRHPGSNSADQRLVGYLLAASVPGAVLGFGFEGFFETAVRSPALVALTLTAAGVWMWIVDRVARRSGGLESLNLLKAVAVGIGQAVALIPGVSRSGASITVGRWVGLGREAAVRFSFLMAIPIIFGAAVLKVPDLFRADITGVDLAAIGFGVTIATLTGLLAIRFLLRYVARNSLAVFAVYRIVLAVVAVYLAVR